MQKKKSKMINFFFNFTDDKIKLLKEVSNLVQYFLPWHHNTFFSLVLCIPTTENSSLFYTALNNETNILVSIAGGAHLEINCKIGNLKC